MDLVDSKPPLDVQVILWEKNKFVQSPRWLFVEKLVDERTCENPVIRLFCAVCDEIKRSKLTPMTLSLEALDMKSLDYEPVTLKRETLRGAPRSLHQSRPGELHVPGTQFFHYWAGQCGRCRVIYWHGREYKPKPFPTI